MDKIEPTPAACPPSDATKRKSFFFQEALQPVWAYRWFHWTLGAAAVLLVASFILPSAARLLQLAEPILVPVLVGLVLAYIFNPLVTFLERRVGIGRPISAAGIIVAGGIVGLLVLILVGPSLYTQTGELAKRIPDQLNALSDRLGDGSLPLPKLRDTAEIQKFLTDLASRIRSGELSISPYLGQAGQALGAGWSLVSSALGFAAYMVLCGIVTAACFFFFSWRFSAIIAWPKPFIPIEYQGEVLRIATLCDKAVSAFIRGRLIQAVIFGTILTVGWSILKVPYAVLFGLLGGLLTLLPYLSIVSLPLAVGAVFFAHLAPGAEPLAWWHLALPAGVYFLAYCVDSFGVEPVIQGKATGLSPLAVLLSVLLGGAIGGILGVILAIPTAACIMIIWREAALPRLKELAGSR